MDSFEDHPSIFEIIALLLFGLAASWITITGIYHGIRLL